MRRHISSRQPRRKAFVMVVVALSIVVLIGLTGFVVDMGRFYTARAQAQKAADAAALAGVPFLNDSTVARSEAEKYAALNGFDIADTAEAVSVTSKVDPTSTDPNFLPTWHRATVSKRIPLYFMPILGLRHSTVNATATAQFIADLLIAASPGGEYGKAPGIVNLSVFGPDAIYSYGDAYSPKYMPDGTSNTEYRAGGYDFQLNVPASYTDSQLAVQIFDPDCYNNGGVDANGTQRIDELRDTTNAIRNLSPNFQIPTTTQYTLSVKTASGYRQVATATYDGTNSQNSDMQWVTPGGFTLDLTDPIYGGSGTAKTFKINVKSINGSSENGFDLRAGKPGSPDSAYPTNGTSISGVGALPMNFNTSGSVTVTLGYVPPADPSGRVTGGTVFVDKFDTDVGSKSVNYIVTPAPSNMPAGGYPGVLSDNGTWKQDAIVLPSDYKGGVWTAKYVAGQQDTSVWKLSATYPTGGPGSIGLVK